MGLPNMIKLYKEYSIVIGKKILYKNKEYEVLDINRNGYLIIKNDKDMITLSSDEINIKESIIE